MMKVYVWDEISTEWATWELDIPVTRDPMRINQALGEAIAKTSPESDLAISAAVDGWEVKSYSTTGGSILTIETRDDRYNLAIIVVNFEGLVPPGV